MKNIDGKNSNKFRSSIKAEQVKAQFLKRLGIFIISLFLLVVVVAILTGKPLEKDEGPMKIDGWWKNMRQWGPY